ncbi:MAG: asparagine synthase-related protein [Gemmataceae bacterium]
MNNRSFVGGIWRRGTHECTRRAALSPARVDEDWGWIGDSTEMFVRGAGGFCRLFTWDGLAILLRGYARPAGFTGRLDLERVAEELRCHYLEQGELAVDALDGSFTVALCDSHAERVLLYRNLVGTGFTYYHERPDGLVFGGNLTELVDLVEDAPAANRDALPSFFLYRCVPGRDTLFAGFHRLLPGEQVCWDRRGFTRSQRHTFASLAGSRIDATEAIDAVDHTMTAILRDCQAAQPRAANLLSGGIDSSYIQAIWNKAVAAGTVPVSYSVAVDHPHTWADTDYAVTASQTLGCRHVLVPADGPYQSYLLDALATTGEPLNHVQSAYFGHLARAMQAGNQTAGLCGEGADSLFGLGLGNQIQNADVVRRTVPGAWLRQAVAGVAGLAGFDRLAYTFRLADRVHDAAWPEHPINRVARFADVAAVQACFGESAVYHAAADRRALLDLFAVPHDPLDRLHASGFLGEAMDSAGLWTTLFNRAGMDLLCPFLDSRMVRLALRLPPDVRYRFRRPKAAAQGGGTAHTPGRKSPPDQARVWPAHL